MIKDFGEQNEESSQLDCAAKGLLQFSISRDIKVLFKFLLSELDVLEREGRIDVNSKAFFRSRILGHGNSALRNLEEELEKFDISLKTLNNNI